MAIRVVLNGEEVKPADIAGDPDAKTIYETEGDDGASLLKAVSGELTFYGRAWEIIRDNLITPVDGRLREIPFLLFDTCSDPDFQAFTGVVRGELIKWCHGECSARTTVLESTETSAAMDCLKSTLIYDNHSGFQTQAHPRMRYCDEIRPEWLHVVVLLLGQFAMLTLDLLTPVIYAVSAVVYALNQIIQVINDIVPGDGPLGTIDLDGDPNTNIFQEWQNIRSGIQETLIGCGRAHPSPLVRSYITNVCSKCGIAFQSSILNNANADYWNMVLWFAPVEKGTRDDSIPYLLDNTPNWSGEMLLDRLKQVFNGRYGIRMIGGVPTLVFERRDQLQGTQVWVDYSQLLAADRITEPLCFNYSKEQPPAYLHIGYSEDGMDEPGNEARRFYRRIVEWNQPFNPVQTKSKEKQFQFGMLRNRRDGIGSDLLDSWVIYPSLTSAVNQYGHAMKVSRGIAQLPKLLIWNGNLVEGEVRRGYDPGQDGGTAFGKPPSETYNFPLNVSTFNVPPNVAIAADAPNTDVYGRFHAIDNPKVLNERGIDWKFEFEYTQAHLETIDLFSTVPLPLWGGTYPGRISRVTINHTQGTILVAGKA